MEPPPFPTKGWTATLAVCVPGPKGGGEVEKDAKKMGEPKDEECFFWRGSVILS